MTKVSKILKSNPAKPKIHLRPFSFTLVVTLHAAFAAGLVTATTPSHAAQTMSVSVSNTGIQGDSISTNPDISGDGRFVAFESAASNLVIGDTNLQYDIFVHDLTTHQTTRVSVDSAGLQSNGHSGGAKISADGRFVTFYSAANNLVTGDTNSSNDVFVHDLTTHQTTRVSVDNAGVQVIGDSFLPDISADGRFVVFESDAPNLVAGDTNLVLDIFAHDRQTHQTTRVSVDSAGLQGNSASATPAISADGRFVAFNSSATNLVAGDTNVKWDFFVRDRQNQQTTRVSVDSAGVQGNGDSVNKIDISADGSFVIFESSASNLVAGDNNGVSDIFAHDLTTHQTSLVSISSTGVQGNSSSRLPVISADDRFVAFESSASNLVAGKINHTFDIFVHDLTNHQTTLESVNSNGIAANMGSVSVAPAISADGRYLAFASTATNLVANDTNITEDVFVRDRLLIPAVEAPPSVVIPALEADLEVNQTVSAKVVSRGGKFTYTIKVTNAGPGSAAEVNLTDIAPSARLVSKPALTPSQGNCSSGQISICRLGTLLAGQQATVKIKFKAKKAGAAVNTVSVNSASQDSRLDNNTVFTKTKIKP
jgi:uncharacterized repeat protein (TIGR01451 family)